MRTKEFFKKSLELIFPKRCPWCDEVIGFAACEFCERELKRLKHVLENEEEREVSEDDIKYFFACFAYEGIVKETIWRLKFKDQKELARPISEHLFSKYKQTEVLQKINLVVPVPVSAKTLKTREYNQSGLLAKAFAQNTGLAYNENLLAKCKETLPQMNLNREERQENIKNAYTVLSGEKIRGKHILIIDDVVTTGSTLRECAKVLINAGAKVCYSLCFASTQTE